LGWKPTLPHEGWGEGHDFSGISRKTVDLLPQPGGFEGLLGIEVGPDPNPLEWNQKRRMRLHLGSRSFNSASTSRRFLRLSPALESLDVLLRHHLLPQPKLIDLLDWKASLLPRGEAARDLGRPPAQRQLRAEGVLAEVDGAGSLRTCHVLGERDWSRSRWRSVAATLDLGPHIENLREAELDRAPRRLGLKRSRSRHCGQFIGGRVATAGAGSRRHRR
jgi:hypothetical protein